MKICYINFNQHANFVSLMTLMGFLSNLESKNVNLFPNATNHGGAVRNIAANMLRVKDTKPFR